MNCNLVTSLLSEFGDERLDAATAWQVQTHLAGCADCTQAYRETEALRRLVQALPVRSPSAGFDAALTERLALTRRPQAARSWQSRLSAAFPRPARLLRPALALGAAGAAVYGLTLLSPQGAPVLTPPPAHAADRAFVADCVAQRRRDAAGEPLADMAAQNLAGHLDNAPVTDDGDPGLF